MLVHPIQTSAASGGGGGSLKDLTIEYWAAQSDTMVGFKNSLNLSNFGVAPVTFVSDASFPTGQTPLFLAQTEHWLYHANDALLNPTGNYSFITWLKVLDKDDLGGIIFNKGLHPSIYSLQYKNAWDEFNFCTSNGVFPGAAFACNDDYQYTPVATDTLLMVYSAYDSINEQSIISVNNGTQVTANALTWVPNANTEEFRVGNDNGVESFGGKIGILIMLNDLLDSTQLAYAYNSRVPLAYADW